MPVWDDHHERERQISWPDVLAIIGVALAGIGATLALIPIVLLLIGAT